MPFFNVCDDLGVKGNETWKDGKRVASFIFDEGSVALINKKKSQGK